jgi:signal transduction histidine kinase
LPFRSRRRLRLRLALEFMAVAGVMNLLLLLIVLGVREDQYRSSFDQGLISRATEVGHEAAREMERDGRIMLESVLESEEGRTCFFEVHDGRGRMLAETSSCNGIVFGPGELPLASRGSPGLGVIDGGRFGRPGEMFRAAAVSVAQPGGDEQLVVHAFSSLAPVSGAIWALRLLLLGFVLPIATLASGVAGWLISDRIFRRIGQVARAAHDLRAGELGQRLDLPTASDEIGEMVAEMNAMIERLDAAFRAQRKFILDVTHELKTPVSIMLAESQVLGRASPVHEPERYRGFVASVEEETRRLGQLLESFLTLARSSHGETYIAESLVSLNEVAIEAAARWEDVGRPLGTRVSVMLHDCEDDGDGVVVRGDQDLLVTMVENLLGAVSESAGPKRILELCIARDHDHATVTVRAIDPSSKLPPTRRIVNQRGHELKLAIVEGVVSLHAGWLQTGETDALVSLPAIHPQSERAEASPVHA